MMFTSLLLAGYLLASSGAGSLRRVADEEDDDIGMGKSLAKVNLSGDTTLEFLEPEEGFIVIVKESPDDDLKKEDEEEALSKEKTPKAPTEIYKAFTGKEAPKALVEAEERMKNAKPEEITEPPPMVEDEDEEMSGLPFEADNDDNRNLISCGSWEQNYCRYLNVASNCACFSCRTNTMQRTWRAEAMQLKTNVYRGHVKHRIRRWKCSGGNCYWKTVVSRWVSAGTMSTMRAMTTPNSDQWWQGRVYNANGDGWNSFVLGYDPNLWFLTMKPLFCNNIY